MVRTKLVGCNFHKASRKTIENDVVKLVREPGNQFDKEAIAVYNESDEKIGYIASPKTVSPGNRKRGCMDNHQLGNIIGSSGRGVVTKFMGYAGFIEVETIK